MTEKNSIKQAYSEIDEFLELLDEKTRNEIPAKLRQFFKDEKDNEYHKGITPNIPIKEQNLHRETLALIALLNLQYWCKDEAEKERLKQIYSNNEKEYQKKLKEKYNIDNIFQSRNKVEEKNRDKQVENLLVEVKKEKWYKKIFKFITKIFIDNSEIR